MCSKSVEPVSTAIQDWKRSPSPEQAARRARICLTKSELHELVDHLPDTAVDGAAVLLEEIAAGRIDPDQAWFWTREWQEKEREADSDLAAGKTTRYESNEEFLAALDERMKSADADP
jgi:hypothetical protein